jgi:hypothetical protein
MTANDMAELDQDVGISIEASPQLRAGQFDLVYDPRVLDGGGGGKTPGRMTVQFVATGDNATPTVINVRFKPVTKTPADTEFRIENVAVKNATGAAVAVVPPPPQLMKLVP